MDSSLPAIPTSSTASIVLAPSSTSDDALHAVVDGDGEVLGHIYRLPSDGTVCFNQATAGGFLTRAELVRIAELLAGVEAAG